VCRGEDEENDWGRSIHFCQSKPDDAVKKEVGAQITWQNSTMLCTRKSSGRGLASAIV
jgi:hypothetical protein